MAYTTIDKSSDYFETKLYTGTGSELALTGVGFQPDWVWIKERNGATNQMLTDSVRGATKTLHSQNADGESTDAQALKSFNSDGFTVGTDGDVNTGSDTYVAWNWKKTADAGFDIVLYTGNATNRTISHSCGSAPKMIITKSRAGNNWFVYHESIGNTKMIKLNTTSAEETKAAIWNSTSPTSSVFSLGTDNDANEDSINFIAYCFAEKQGYSKFGSYVGNGNADGTFVYTGFRPAWVMIKRTDGANGWFISDDQRVGFNSATTNSATLGNVELNANTSRTEAEGNTNIMDIFSNGFKMHGTGNDTNGSGSNYITMAFASNPFTTSTGVPTTAR